MKNSETKRNEKTKEYLIVSRNHNINEIRHGIFRGELIRGFFKLLFAWKGYDLLLILLSIIVLKE